MMKISLDDDTYWKLQELEIKMRCRTSGEFIDKLCKNMEKI